MCVVAYVRGRIKVPTHSSDVKRAYRAISSTPLDKSVESFGSVVKSHDDHIRGACSDKPQLLCIWYLCKENLVCWIILLEKPPLHI